MTGRPQASASLVRTCSPNLHRPSLYQYKERMLVAVVAAAWILLALAAALVLGCGIRVADRRAPLADHLVGLPAELTAEDVLGAPTV